LGLVRRKEGAATGQSKPTTSGMHHLLNLLLCGVKPQAAGFTERKDRLFFFILLGCDARWVLFLLWKLFGIT
jgi:hypothetical protein